MEYCLAIFTHSDYSYLWPIIEESFKKNNLNNLHTIFISDKTNITKPGLFKQYIEYDDNLCYAKRWTNNIIPNINKKYIIVVHDIHIIISLMVKEINKLVSIMDFNSIDRISLNVFYSEDVIKENDIIICNLNNAIGNTLIPYDLCPAIWNINSLNKLFLKFNDETYRTSELNSNLQKYCENYLKCYGIQKTDEKIYYCLGRPYSKIFSVLFITIKNELLKPFDVYMDMKEDFFYYLNKYKLDNYINTNDNYSFILYQNNNI